MSKITAQTCQLTQDCKLATGEVHDAKPFAKIRADKSFGLRCLDTCGDSKLIYPAFPEKLSLKYKFNNLTPAQQKKVNTQIERLNGLTRLNFELTEHNPTVLFEILENSKPQTIDTFPETIVAWLQPTFSAGDVNRALGLALGLTFTDAYDPWSTVMHKQGRNKGCLDLHLGFTDIAALQFLYGSPEEQMLSSPFLKISNDAITLEGEGYNLTLLQDRGVLGLPETLIWDIQLTHNISTFVFSQSEGYLRHCDKILNFNPKSSMFFINTTQAQGESILSGNAHMTLGASKHVLAPTQYSSVTLSEHSESRIYFDPNNHDNFIYLEGLSSEHTILLPYSDPPWNYSLTFDARCEPSLNFLNLKEGVAPSSLMLSQSDVSAVHIQQPFAFFLPNLSTAATLCCDSGLNLTASRFSEPQSSGSHYNQSELIAGIVLTLTASYYVISKTYSVVTHFLRRAPWRNLSL